MRGTSPGPAPLWSSLKALHAFAGHPGAPIARTREELDGLRLILGRAAASFEHDGEVGATGRVVEIARGPLVRDGLSIVGARPVVKLEHATRGEAGVRVPHGAGFDIELRCASYVSVRTFAELVVDAHTPASIAAARIAFSRTYVEVLAFAHRCGDRDDRAGWSRLVQAGGAMPWLAANGDRGTKREPRKAHP